MTLEFGYGREEWLTPYALLWYATIEEKKISKIKLFILMKVPKQFYIKLLSLHW